VFLRDHALQFEKRAFFLGTKALTLKAAIQELTQLLPSLNKRLHPIDVSLEIPIAHATPGTCEHCRAGYRATL
jgi:hypothetical protein